MRGRRLNPSVYNFIREVLQLYNTYISDGFNTAMNWPAMHYFVVHFSQHPI
jgi:hypothetical protein